MESDNKGRNGASDPLVVSTALIADLLQRFVDTFNAEHPVDTRPPHDAESATSSYGLGEHMPPGFGGVNYLSYKTGLTDRNIRRILRRETKVTTLEVADRLLTAIGRGHLIGREVPVIPNPLWTREKWLRWHIENGSCDYVDVPW